MLSLTLLLPRLLLFFSYLLLGLLLAIILSLSLGSSWYTHMAGKQIKVMWTKGIALILGLKIKREGKISEDPRLIVSNHISWLDIVAIGATQPCVFIAKSTVVNWPIIGYLAKMSGTLFVDRQNRKDLYKVMEKSKSAIDEGLSLVFFPEATTTNGKEIKTFHPSIYQTAIDTHSTTQAVAICYPVDACQISAAPYIDDDSFISHLIRILKTPGIDVTLHYCTPIPTTYNHNRKALAQSTQNQVSKVLAL